MNFECFLAPLEHYHTMLIDEKCQTYDYILTNNEYIKIRSKIIKLLLDTGKRLRQTESTINLAITYTDIILNTNNIISE